MKKVNLILLLFIAGMMSIVSAQNHTQQVTAIQYYFNTDPGVGVAGNGGIISVTPAASINQNFSFSVPSSLSNGIQHLYVRAKDEFGQWSITERRTFFVFTPPVTQDITAIQYYFDTDPGVGVAGNGAIQIVTPSSNINQTLAITVPGTLGNGIHNLFVRVQDASGSWSITERRTFFILTPPITQNITAIQYYFDNDPGVGVAGNGAIQIVTPSSNINQTLVITVPGTLSNGIHNLFVRVQDASGSWSITERRTFFIQQIQNTELVTAMEYYFDTDPGVGNGVSVPVTASDTINTVIDIGVPCLTSGTHYFYMRAKDEYGRWAIIARDTVIISTGVASSVITPSGPIVMCAGDSVVLSTVANNGMVYQWQKDTVDIAGATGTLYTATATGNYSLKTKCNGDSAVSNYVSVTLDVFSLSITSNSPVCEGDSLILSASGGTGFSWTGPNGFTDTVFTVTIPNAILADSGLYTLTTSSGLCNDSTSTYVTINPQPVVSFTGLPSLLCDLNTVTLAGSPAGGVFSGTGISGNDFTPPSAGTYSIIYTYTDVNGCSNSDTQQVVVKQLQSVVSSNSPVCESDTIIISASGGETYSWTGPNSFSFSGETASLLNASNIVAGTYSVVVGLIGCSDTDTLTTEIAVTPLSVLSLTGLNAAYCQNDAASILVGLPAGGIYSGTGVSGNLFTPSSIGSTVVSYISTPYLGCPADTIEKTTVVNALPTATITSSDGNVLCADSSITLSVPSGNSYLWNTGSTTNQITASTSGDYSVVVTNSNNCSAASPVFSISPDPSISITTNIGSSICAGESATLTFNAASILWSTGATTSSIVVAPAASQTYTVEGTSANGCIHTDSYEVVVNPSLTPGAVSYMYPTDGATNVSYPVTLSWFPGVYNSMFDLYIWDSTQPQPSTPFADSLTAINYVVGFGLLSGVNYNWQIVSKNGNCTSTAGPIQDFTLVNMPDLVVQNVLAPATASAGQNISVSWQVMNAGGGSTGSQQWGDRIFISADTILQEGLDPVLQSATNFSALPGGLSYSNNINVTIPFNLGGNYYIIVKTDAYNHLSEVDENANTGYSAIVNITIPPWPDLRVESVIIPTNGFAGKVVSITYTVKNYGGIAISSASTWKDKIYVSDQPFLNTQSAFEVSDTNNNMELLPDSTYTRTFGIKLPYQVYGNHYVYVETDAGNEIYETPYENNNVNSDVILISYIPPDLVVTEILEEVISDNPGTELTEVKEYSSGQVMDIRWKVTNQGLDSTNLGLAAGETAWVDGLYLSANQNYDLSNALLVLGYAVKIPFHVIMPSTFFGYSSFPFFNLPVDDAPYDSSYITVLHVQNYVCPICPYENSFSNYFILDTIPSGDYYFYAKADINNQLNELNFEDNNVLRSDTIVRIVNPDLKITNVQVDDATPNRGAVIEIEWDFSNIGTGAPNFQHEISGIGDVINKNMTSKILVCTNDTFETSTAIELWSETYNTEWVAGYSNNRTKSVTLPDHLVGDYYVFVYTDYNNDVYENGSESNNVNSTGIYINIALNAYPDLSANTLTMPSATGTQTPCPVYYKVANVSSGETDNDNWNDSLFVSKKSTWVRDSAAFVKAYSQSHYIAPQNTTGDCYEIADTVLIPHTSTIPHGTDSSNYYFYLVSDATETVFENNSESNNIKKSAQVLIYDLTVDLSVTSVSCTTYVSSGRPVDITWSIKNTGENLPVPNYYWHDAFYLSADTVFDTGDLLIGSKTSQQGLQTNQSYTATETFTIPNGISGNYYLFAYADAYDQILLETYRDNNRNKMQDSNGDPLPINITASPVPDLVVLYAHGPNSVQSGQYLDLEYKVENTGLGEAYPSNWQDALYISTDLVLDNTDILIATKSVNQILNTNDSYIWEFEDVLVPSHLSGNYYLLLKTDVNGAVYEGTNESNNLNYWVANIIQPPLSDLIVNDVSFPNLPVIDGSSIIVNYYLKNIGENPVNGSATEGIYLSKDTVWDINDVVLGTSQASVYILPGNTFYKSVIKEVNGAMHGYYYVIVRADLLNNIVESDDYNNNLNSEDTVEIIIPNLPLNTLTSNTLYNSNYMYYRIEIVDSLEGQTLLVTLNTADSINGINEIYASFEKVPTRSSYEYAFSTPFFGNQEIIIPQLDSGTYYITIYGNSILPLVTTQSIDLYASIIPFSILSADANKGGNTGNVTVKITGSKFTPGMTAHLLSNTSALDIPSGNISYVNSTTVFATFNLNGKPLGIYNLTLNKPANSEVAVLDSGFTIEAGNSGGFYIGGIVNTGMTGNPGAAGCNPGATAGINGQLQITIDCPEAVFINSIVPMTILFGNAGNVDIPVPTRMLVSTSGIPISLTVAGLSEDLHEIFLEFRENGGPTDILRAGASGGITVYAKAAGPGVNYFSLR